MSDQDPGGPRNALDLIPSMGWIPLPYGCAAMLRNRVVGSGQRAWSWLILVPWAVNDSKPWIDGTKLFDDATKGEDGQREEILQEMRTILDSRYGESVAGRTVDEFLRSLEDEG